MATNTELEYLGRGATEQLVAEVKALLATKQDKGESVGGVSSWNDLTDKPFGEEYVEATLLEEKEFVFVYDYGFGCYASGGSPASVTFVADKEYTIVWDGESYLRTAFSFEVAEGVTCVAVGNPLAAGLAANEDKFAIIYDPSNDATHFMSLETNDVHTIGIRHDTTMITTIDPKFLPMDTIDARIEELAGSGGSSGGSSLPEVTTDDAGKFLRVSSAGAWVVESVLNAEEASF